MTLFNPYADTVRNPNDKHTAQLFVFSSDGLLTADQRAKVQHLYSRFRMELKTACGSYFVRNFFLEDGTRVRVVANNGDDQVYVWPVGGGKPVVDIEQRFFAFPGYRFNSGLTSMSPNFSGEWQFEGATQPPNKPLKAKRKREDSPGTKQHPGSLTWWSDSFKVNKKPVTLSWRGGATRYGRMNYYLRNWQPAVIDSMYYDLYGNPGVNYKGAWDLNWVPYVWTNGVRHLVRRQKEDLSIEDAPVISAALRHISKEESEADAGNWLYVIGFEDRGFGTGADWKLCVYRGRIKPLSGKTVTLTKLFEVPPATFWVSHSGSTNPFVGWQTLLQPLYFDASCKHAAGLVSRSDGSFDSGRTNAALLTVDIDAQTTAVTRSHVSVAQTLVNSNESAQNGVAFGTSTNTATRIMYGAVDWHGDDMRLALVQVSYVTETTYTGSAVSTGWQTGSITRTATKTARTQYRVYYTHNNQTLAQKDSGTISVGSFNTTGTSRREYLPGHEGEDTNSWIVGTGTGYRKEQFTSELHLSASVEGGDLRHDYVTVLEMLEIGSSDYDRNFLACAPGTPSGVQGPSFVDLPNFGPGGSNPPSIYFTGGDNTGLRRKPAGRLGVWRQGTLLDETTPWEASGVHGSGSVFGLTPSGAASSFLGETFETYLRTVTSSNGVSYTGLPGAGSDSTSETREMPWRDCGLMYSNTFAADSSGDYVFYDLGQVIHVPPSTYNYGNGWPASILTKAAFVLHGVRYPFDVSINYPDGSDPTFAAPIFVNQAPAKPL